MKKTRALILAVAALATACNGRDTTEEPAPFAGQSAAAGHASGQTQPAGTPFPAGSYMADLQRRGRIMIGVRYDAPPMGRLNPFSNRVEGFEADIGRVIAGAIFGDERKAEFVETGAANGIPLLREDRADLVISAISITDARAQEIDVSNAYYQAGQSVLVPKDSSIKGVDGLSGKRVCVMPGSTSETTVRQRAPLAELVLAGSHAECLAALQTKRTDAISADDTILAGLAAYDKNTKLVGGIFTEEPYAIGIKRGRPEFVEFVNKALDDMIQDGRWKQSYDTWLGEPTGVSADEALRRFR